MTDLAILSTAVIAVNVLLVTTTLRAHDFDRGAYLIAFGPANAAVAVLALASTPLLLRFNPRLSAKLHITLSLLIPVAAIVAWAACFMSSAP